MSELDRNKKIHLPTILRIAMTWITENPHQQASHDLERKWTKLKIQKDSKRPRCHQNRSAEEAKL